MKKLNFKKIKIIDLKKIDKENLNNNFINLIDINYNLKFKPKITNLSKVSLMIVSKLHLN